MSLETIMVKSARVRATPRNVSSRGKRAPAGKVSIFSDPEAAPRHALCANDLDLRLGTQVFLRHLEELHRKLIDLESRPLHTSIPVSAEFNTMVTETCALLSLYAEFGRQLATREVSAADQTWPTPC
jgi:hypothetical protein